MQIFGDQGLFIKIGQLLEPYEAYIGVTTAVVTAYFSIISLFNAYLSIRYREANVARKLLETIFDVPRRPAFLQRLMARIAHPFREKSIVEKAIRSDLGKLTRFAWKNRGKAPIDILLTVRVLIEREICSGNLGKGLLRGHLWSNEPDPDNYINPQNMNLPKLPIPQVGILADDTFKDNVDKYFEALIALNDTEQPEFVSDISVSSGFVSPIILLGGLLAYLKESWKPIIQKYGKYTTLNDDPLRNEFAATQLRNLQAFQYDCWLIWGPSIPICGSGCRVREDSESIEALQYGYGDENSSVIIIGDKKSELIRDLSANFGGRPAFHATVKGRLKYAGRIKTDNNNEVHIEIHDEDTYPAPLRNAIKAEPQRLIIDIRRRDSDGSTEGTIKGDANANKYYSAYLWVMFVLIDNNGKLIKPEGGPDWMALLPFFEHGNLADNDTYSLLKRQLARKAVDTIHKLGRDLNLKQQGCNFAYVCSFDDSGCNHPKGESRVQTELKFKNFYTGQSIREEIISAIAEASVNTNVAELPTIDLELYMKKENAFSACRMPEKIESYYKAVREQ